MKSTELELYLESNGIYMVNKVFDILINNKLNNITYINIYQYGINKKGNVYHASIFTNDNHTHIEGNIDKFNKLLNKFMEGKQCITNNQGKRISCDFNILNNVESHVKQFIDVKKIIGSHELLNYCIKEYNK